MKLEALLASAGTLALTWRCARVRGLDPVLALLVVGANPLWVIYGLGGAHNDLIMTLFMMAAVRSDARRTRRLGGRLGGRGRAREGDRRGAAAVHDPRRAASSAPILGALGALALAARWSATPCSASTGSTSSPR